MSPDSPAEALGSKAPGLRDLLVETIQARHALAAEAHAASESRYATGFGSQWRDLMDDTLDALKPLGFPSCKLAPGGHEIPVVNDCLVYVWRVPNNPNAVKDFASSPTRRNSFTISSPLQSALLEPSLSDEEESICDNTYQGEIEPVLQEVGGSMPLVLVLVKSTPRQLQSIEWAVAVLDGNGKVALRGTETIWEMESVTDSNTTNVEAFDSGSPVIPKIEPREDEGVGRDA